MLHGCDIFIILILIFVFVFILRTELETLAIFERHY